MNSFVSVAKEPECLAGVRGLVPQWDEEMGIKQWVSCLVSALYHMNSLVKAS